MIKTLTIAVVAAALIAIPVSSASATPNGPLGKAVCHAAAVKHIYIKACH